MNAHSLTVTASDSSPRGRVLLTALLALTLLCATALAGPAPALAAGCPHESLRSEANSTLLPQCRAYEMVSPVDTADSGVGEAGFVGAAPNGEAAEFGSIGGFAGTGTNYGINHYIARRVENVGWQTSAVGIPATLRSQPVYERTASFDLTKQLETVVFLAGERQGSFGVFLSVDLTAAPALSYVELHEYRNVTTEGPMDESSNFAMVFFGAGFGSGGPVLEISGAGGPAEALRPVSVVGGNTIMATVGNGIGEEGGTLFHAVSNDGAEVFFTPGAGEGVSGESYVRVNGSKTLPLGGLFQGASEDGAKVFLRSAGSALAMDVIDSEPGHEVVTAKVAISHGDSALYVRSGDDGSHVYFISEGVLAKNENGNEPIKEKAEAGKTNLYVYDTVTKETAFIAQALPGGSDAHIAEGREVEAQVNGCPSRELGEVEEPGCEGGRFFVFTSTAKLTPDAAGPARQVFEYDAKTGRLARVSTGEGGYDENGNAGAAGASIAAPDFSGGNGETQTALFEDNSRAVSDDGSTVVFSTARALSPRALNDQQPGQSPQDVYESHDGQVNLLSTGHSPTSDEQPAITPSGRDVFFTSNENILPQKSDGLKGLFDARIGGGFPAALVPEGGCNGDACQGPPSVPNLLAAPASATFTGLGNPAPPAPTPAVKAKPKSKPAKCKKGYVRKKGRCVKRPKAKKAGNDRRTKS